MIFRPKRLPCLPQSDPAPDRRQAQRYAKRAEYGYNYDLVEGIAVAGHYPPTDSYPTKAKLQLIGVAETLNFNHDVAAVQGLNPLRHAGRRAKRAVKRRGGARRHAAAGRPFHSLEATVAKGPRLQMSRPSDFRSMFAFIDLPPLLEVLGRRPHGDDVLFAWQRVAGANPLLIAPADKDFLKGMKIPKKAVEAALGKGWTLAKALGEGRLFGTDHRILEGVPTGTWHFGTKRKFIYGPRALFAWREQSIETPGYLFPVAIQCETGGPVFTPADGVRWKMAKLTVQIADGNLHESVLHLGRTHLVMEALTLASRRNLAPQHPLMVLLAPHLEGTLTINDQAAHNLIAVGGIVPTLFAPTRDALIGLIRDDLKTYNVLDSKPVYDRNSLLEHPFMQDAHWIYNAIENFVRSYVGLYYGTDETVVTDSELQQMWTELGSTDGGRLNVPAMDSVETLIEHLSALIWIGSGQHSALNFAQFPFMGFVPNMPGSGYAPAPTLDTPQEEVELFNMYPPLDRGWLHFDTVFQLSNVQANTLGHYPRGHFVDPRALEVVGQFKRELTTASGIIKGQNENRLLTYPFLIPEHIPASIHI